MYVLHSTFVEIRDVSDDETDAFGIVDNFPTDLLFFCSTQRHLLNV